jgi:uncharacterized protein YjbI with pentapeptide repeats
MSFLERVGLSTAAILLLSHPSLVAAPKSVHKVAPHLGAADSAATFYYDQDFVTNPSLVAVPDQAVILTLAPGSGPQQHMVRYQLAAGSYNFCLAQDAALVSMSVTDSVGNSIASVQPGTCLQPALQPNTFTITVVHDGTKVTGDPRIMFIQFSRAPVSVVNADGAPKTGYWAIQPDPSQDPAGASRQGRLRALPLQNIVPGANPAILGMPLAADWTSVQFDDAALLRLDQPALLQNDVPVTTTPAFSPQDNFVTQVLFGNSSSPPVASSLNGHMNVDDRANGKLRLGATSIVGLLGQRWSYLVGSSFIYFRPIFNLNPPPPDFIGQLLFRFFPALKQLPPPVPAEGEVVLYQGCNFSGNATVFALDTPSLSALTSAITTIDKNTASIQLGPNTQLTLYSEPGYSGISQVIQSNTACLDSFPIGRGVSSFQIRPFIPNVSVSASCISCKLQGANLAGTNMAGSTLRGSNLSGATFANSFLTGSDLTYVTFSQASVGGLQIDQSDLTGSDLTGIDLHSLHSMNEIRLDNVVGLAGSSLQNLVLSNLSLRYMDLEYTNLAGAQMRGTDFTGADMAQAQLSGPSTDLSESTLTSADMVGASFNQANLTGAHLNTGELAFATFTGTNATSAVFDDADVGGTAFSAPDAILNGASFQGANLGASLYSEAQLGEVKLQKAVFDGQQIQVPSLANLDFTGASFQGSNFAQVSNYSGAKFIGANMSGAVFPPGALAGADLTSAILTGAHLAGVDLRAAASIRGITLDQALGLNGADMSGIVLNGSSLRQINLSGTKLYGAQLNHVNLDGADLSGAFLNKSSPAKGVAASLSGAYMRNVNLSQAQLAGANLTNASFYGTVAAGQGSCSASRGFTSGCASAAGAVLDNTQLSGAYLFGVDFTGAQISGVQFSNAFLAGANFANAVIAADTTSGTNSGFPGAFLQGTNLATAAQISGVSFIDSFVDFSPQGNTIYVLLNGTHTLFPGYWGTPGQPVCAEASYPQATTVPTADPTITCPNGNTYSAGCGAANADASNPNWASAVQFSQIASYQFPATYPPNPPPTPVCTFDPNWLQGSVGAPPPKPPEPRPPHRRPHPRKH